MKDLKEVQAVVGENFAVKWEDSPEFKSYIKWIKENGRDFDGSLREFFYGVEYGYFVCMPSKYYQVNPKVLTAAEIMAIINERTIEDIDREVAALLKEKAELEAAQPLTVIANADTFFASGSACIYQHFSDGSQIPRGKGVIIDTAIFDIKMNPQPDGTTIITFHKKAKQ
jgi:hypothetical protein